MTLFVVGYLILRKKKFGRQGFNVLGNGVASLSGIDNISARNNPIVYSGFETRCVAARHRSTALEFKANSLSAAFDNKINLRASLRPVEPELTACIEKLLQSDDLLNKKPFPACTPPRRLKKVALRSNT